MMKKNDKKLYLEPMKAKELLEIKGGNRKIPVGSLAPMARSNRWEEVDIRFGGNGDVKNHKPGAKNPFIRMR